MENIYKYSFTFEMIHFTLFHTESFSEKRFAEMYNDIISTQPNIIDTADLLDGFCKKFGFFRIQESMFINLSPSSMEDGYINNVEIDTSNLDDKKYINNYIDVDTCKKL